MNKGDDCFPKFFKVYLPDDSGDDLELPISFNSYIPKPLPKKVIVRSIYGNVWKMALRKCGGDVEMYVMVDGWKRIVKDEDLKGGEFLAFEFDGSRFFNFCIYGERTCKRLGSLVRTKEMKDESDGEEDGRSSDDNIVLDDDDDDEEDDDDDQDYGDEEKCNEDIIVLDDDSDDDNDDDADDGDDDDGDDDGEDDDDYDDEDFGGQDIIVLDDDDDVDDDEQDSGDREKPSEDIIVLDDDDDDDDDLADDENERRRGVETERKEKGSSGVYMRSDGEDERQYLDNAMNPFFIVNQNLQSKIYARIPTRVINDYGLRFPELIYLIDPLEKRCGKLKTTVKGQTIKGFESIIRRNQVKPSDKMICELFREMNGLVCEIKVHVIRG